MKRIIGLFGLLLGLISVSASAQFGNADFPASDESPDGMLVIESEDDVPEPIRMQELVYAIRDSGELKLKLVTPAGSAGGNPFGGAPQGPGVPLVLYVQGSAWFAQDNWSTLPRIAAYAEETGFAIASVQYRPSTMAIAPAQLEDVKSAIRFLRANADQFGIDPDRIGIWGDSSGGHMAAMAGTTIGEEQFVTDDNSEISSGVSAVVDFFGPTDFRAMSSYPGTLDHDGASSPESTVIGGPIQEEEYTEAVALYNPITYISPDKDLPPFLIMHGDEDNLVPFNQSVLLYEALKGAGQDVTFYKIRGAGHGSRFYTPAVMEKVTAFFNEHL